MLDYDAFSHCIQQWPWVAWPAKYFDQGLSRRTNISSIIQMSMRNKYITQSNALLNEFEESGFRLLIKHPLLEGISLAVFHETPVGTDIPNKHKTFSLILIPYNNPRVRFTDISRFNVIDKAMQYIRELSRGTNMAEIVKKTSATLNPLDLDLE